MRAGWRGALRWMDPEAVAQVLMHAMQRGELYAFTHPELASLVLDRHRTIEGALVAAARFQEAGQ